MVGYRRGKVSPIFRVNAMGQLRNAGRERNRRVHRERDDLFHCGHPVSADALSRETRPCTRCGSARGMSSEKPVPYPEHKQRINKSKGFEIGAVVVMILVGLTFVSIRGGTSTDDASRQEVPRLSETGRRNSEIDSSPCNGVGMENRAKKGIEFRIVRARTRVSEEWRRYNSRLTRLR